MKSRSVVRQTALAVLASQLVCAGAFTTTALLHQRQVQLRALDVTLQGRSDSLLGAIQDAEDPEDSVIIDPHELNIPEGDIYAVYNHGGRLLGASKDAPPELSARTHEGFSSLRVNGHSYRLLETEGLRIIDRAENHGVGLERPVTILYAVRGDSIWHEVLAASGFYVSLSLLLLISTGALTVVLLRRALTPLQELATAASTVSVRTLEFVPPVSALQVRELQPLAHTLSSTVEGLRRSFEQQHRFVGDAAHELKTAVAVTRSSIQLMILRRRTSADQALALDALFQDNLRVEDLVNRMLSLARVEERHSPPSHPVDLAWAGSEALGRLQNFAETHHVGLRQTAQASVVVLMTAEDIGVVVSNLVVNAVQHSQPSGFVDIAIEGADGAAILRVRDYGAGIAADALPHIFERFYREDTSRSRETGGAGLGLAICKSIVDSAGGTIAVESARGSGTSVTVTLPRA